MKSNQRWRNVLSVAALVLAFLAMMGVYKSTEHTFVATVTGVERVVNKDASYWLILTDKEPLANTDSLVFGKWDSSTLMGRITAGHTYRFRVVGWRSPVLSMYRNVLAAELLND